MKPYPIIEKGTSTMQLTSEEFRRLFHTNLLPKCMTQYEYPPIPSSPPYIPLPPSPPNEIEDLSLPISPAESFKNDNIWMYSILTMYNRSSDIRMANDIRTVFHMNNYFPLSIKELITKLKLINYSDGITYKSYDWVLSHITSLLSIEMLYV